MPLSSFQPYGPAEVFPGMILAPNGGLVHFVHSSGAAALDLLPMGMNAPTPGGFFTSIAAAGAACRANRGDQIVVLPGSTDTISTVNPWSTMPAGVTIRGMGEPGTTQRPTIQFTAATATLVLPAGCVIDNFQVTLDATAATVVAAPFTINAAGCKFTRNQVRLATSATQLATAPFTVAVGGDDFVFADNHLWTVGAGTFATNPTNNVLVTGAVKGFTFLRNRVFGGTAAATGQLQFSAAATNSLISGNKMQNMFATSTSNIVGFAGVTGMVEYNTWCVGNSAGAAGTEGVTVIGSWQFAQNFCTDSQGSAILSPVAGT